MADNNELPTMVSEAVNRLLSELPIETKYQIKDSTDDSLIIFHFGLGVAIRNDFRLWEKDSKLLEDCKKISGDPNLHVDDASGIIIKTLWKRLQKFPPPELIWED